MRPRRYRTGLLVAILLPAVAHAAPATRAPEARAVLASVLIPNLDGFLGHIEAAGGTVSPGAIAPGMLKGMLATKLGDPGLASLGPGPIMGVMLEGAGGAPQFALFIPVRASEPYAAALAKQGWKTKADTGLLAAAATQEALDAVWALKDTYRTVSEAPVVAHDLRLEFRAERLAATYGPIMQMGLSAMASRPAPSPGTGATPRSAAPNPAQAQRILALELKAVMAALASTESLRWDVDVDAAALSGEMALTLKGGSPLALLATMPVHGPNPARGLISDQGLINSEWRGDPKKVSDFMGVLLDEMAKDPETAEFAPADMRALVADMSRCSGGQGAYSLRPAAGGVGTAETVMTVLDDRVCLSLMERGISAAMGPGSSLQKMYQDQGANVSMSLQKNARTHGGVTVHRLKIVIAESGKAAVKVLPAGEGGKVPPKPTPNIPSASGLSNPMLASLLRDTEFAFRNGYYVASQDPDRLDQLIDLAASGPRLPFDSGSELLPDANMALSYDFAGLMKAIASGLPEGKATPFANLPSSEPVRFAMTLSHGQLDSRWRMPLAPIAAIAQSAKATAEAASPGSQQAPSKPPAKKKP